MAYPLITSEDTLAVVNKVDALKNLLGVSILKSDIRQVLLQKALENGGSLQEEFIVFLKQFLGPSYPITVNYDLGNEEAVEQSGLRDKLPFGADAVSRLHYPKGIRIIGLELIAVPATTSLNRAHKILAEQGMRAANFAEILEFGKVYRGELRDSPILALNAVEHRQDGGKLVVGLQSGDLHEEWVKDTKPIPEVGREPWRAQLLATPISET